MKRALCVFLAVCIAMGVILYPSSSVYAVSADGTVSLAAVENGWVKQEGIWYYYRDGAPSTGWLMDGGSWFYLSSTGAMVTGWKLIDGFWYYFDVSGRMLDGWQMIDGSLYYFYSTGAMAVGWKQVGINWYYLTDSGAAAVGWKTVGGRTYYFGADGAMAVGKVMIGDQIHKFDMQGNWLGQSNYFFSSEAMQILKHEEGFSRTPYWDYSQWTVGYGTMCPDNLLEYYRENGITEDEAELLLREHMLSMEEAVEAYINKYQLKLSPSQYDALTLFTYNCGSYWTIDTTDIVHKSVRDGAEGSEMIRAFSLWCNAGGSFLEPLMRRRLCEAHMYLNGVYTTTPPDNYAYVRYDANGGTTYPRVQGYDVTQTPAIVTTATHTDYALSGWYTSPTGGTKVTVLDASTKGMTLYAQWSDPTAAPQPGATSVQVTVTHDSVNLRTGPGTDYANLTTKAQANKGDKLTIVETSAKGGFSWGRFTEYGGGWIALNYTDYSQAILNQSPKWIWENGNWYYGANGIYKTGWQMIGGVWYYFKPTGAMATGWQQLGSTWYYLEASGAMVTKDTAIGGVTHRFNSSGVWLGEAVSVKNGWALAGGTWYYYKSGTMATGWQMIGGVWYYFKPTGAMATGWQQLGSTWYYLEASGAMVTGTCVISGVTYHFNASGVWIG